jgi:hypothetical protein
MMTSGGGGDQTLSNLTTNQVDLMMERPIKSSNLNHPITLARQC